MLRCDDDALQWVARLEIAEDSRTRQYLDALDNHLERILCKAGEPPSPGFWTSDDSLRELTAQAGYLAFFYACPRSRFHRDARLLAGFREVLAFLQRHQAETGELAKGPVAHPPHPHASHGQAWFLEPLLFGATWLREDLSAEEKAQADRMFYRAADFIAARPIQEVNNRGVIVCAVLALCGRYFRERRFLDEAIRWFHGEPAKVFDKTQGQIFEGPGPDGNYSGTTYEYLYLYRLMSGDVSIDPAMIAALRWYARIMDPNGRQMLFGCATRHPVGHSPAKIHDILPALERYTRDEPFFQQLIEQYLPLAGQTIGGMGHSISPTIWALLEHRPASPPAEAPAWYSDMRAWYWEDPELGPQHFAYNEGYDCLYFPVRTGKTSTCVDMRGRSPHKDLQCWTYDRERPVVCPTLRHASRTRAWGIDTAVQGISHIKLPNFCWVLGDVDGLFGQWEAMWRYYVFTPRTTFTFTDGEMGRIEAEWAVDTEQCGEPQVEPDGLSYSGRHGRLWAPRPPAVKREDGVVLIFRWPFENPPAWFAFSDETFRLEKADPGHMVFHDASGRYDVRYRFVSGAPDVAERIPCFAWAQRECLTIRRA